MDYTRLQQAVTDSLTTLGEQASAYLPSLAGAAILVLIGWLLARLARGTVNRVAGGIVARIGRLTASGDGLQRLGTQSAAVSTLAATVYWLIVVVFTLAAIRVLELPFVDAVAVTIGSYLPHLFAAVLVVIVGYVAGSLARGAMSRSARAAGVAYEEALGRIVQAIIVAVSLIVAIDELGIDTTLLVIGAGVFLAATLGGAAVAFGLGARTSASNLLASYYVQRSYRPGHVVRIGDVEGRILEIGETVVVVETNEGKVHLPARLFSEQASLLVAETK